MLLLVFRGVLATAARDGVGDALFRLL